MMQAFSMRMRGRALGGGLPYADYTDDLLACWSVRKCVDSAGYCMRVRRDSDDAEMDVGFDGSDDMDTANMLSWSGSDSVFVKTWYDQLGTHDLTQTTTGNQPRLVNAGTLNTVNGIAGVKANSSNVALVAASNVSPNTHTAASLQLVYRSETNSNALQIVSPTYLGGFRGTVGVRADWNGSNVAMRMAGGGSTGVAVVNNGSLHVAQAFCVPNGGNGYFDLTAYQNGSFDYSHTSQQFGGCGVGAGLWKANGSTAPSYGSMQELLLWDSDLSADQAELAAIANDYFGYY